MCLNLALVDISRRKAEGHRSQHARDCACVCGRIGLAVWEIPLSNVSSQLRDSYDQTSKFVS